MAAAKKSRFLLQLEASLRRFESSNGDATKTTTTTTNTLGLHFVGCSLETTDVELLEQRVSTVLGEAPAPASKSAASILLHLSLERCQMSNAAALQALQKFCADRRVQSFNFSGFHDKDDEHAKQLIVGTPAHRLTALELSLRAPVSPLLEPCTNLQTLKLNARWNGAAAAIPSTTISELVTAACLSLHHLHTFELTRCQLSDQGLALLTGGLLALRDSLQHVRLQTQGDGLTWRSLPLLAHWLTELPGLQTLDVELLACRHLLQRQASESAEVEATILEEFHLLTRSLQECQQQSVRLAWSQVGWTEDAALGLLEAAAYNDSVSNLQLKLQESHSHFMQTERFVYQLATHLPQMQNVTELSLIDDTLQSGDAVWWDVDKQDLLCEAVDKNTALHTLEIRLGHFDIFLEPYHAEQVASALQRNVQASVQQQLLQGRDPTLPPLHTKKHHKQTQIPEPRAEEVEIVFEEEPKPDFEGMKQRKAAREQLLQKAMDSIRLRTRGMVWEGASSSSRSNSPLPPSSSRSKSPLPPPSLGRPADAALPSTSSPVPSPSRSTSPVPAADSPLRSMSPVPPSSSSRTTSPIPASSAPQPTSPPDSPPPNLLNISKSSSQDEDEDEDEETLNASF